MLDLNAIRKRHEAATEEPWHRHEEAIHAKFSGSDGRVQHYIVAETISHTTIDTTRQYANAEFIAHARRDIPALLRIAEAAKNVAAWTPLDDDLEQCRFCYGPAKPQSGDDAYHNEGCPFAALESALAGPDPSGKEIDDEPAVNVTDIYQPPYEGPPPYYDPKSGRMRVD